MPDASPGPTLTAGVQAAPRRLRPTHPGGSSRVPATAGGRPVARSAALGLEHRADAGGQGARRGALRGAAHGQALRGQGAGGGGADGRELQGERRASAVPADSGGRRAWGPGDALSAGHRSSCESLWARRGCRPGTGVMARRLSQGLAACPVRGHEAPTWGRPPWPPWQPWRP